MTHRVHRNALAGRALGLLSAACCLLVLGGPAAAENPPLSVTLGHSVATVNGPWKFHTGDDPRWADPAFDDSAWESVDLTPPPGAHDSDVGLAGYVPGWGSRGHADYVGYAWYRIHLDVSLPQGQSLALAGPFAVDSAYQAYVNGRLLGGLGDFSGATPTAYSSHQPRLFALPPDLARGGPLVLALRVWMGPWAVDDSEAGGIHIAPLLGEQGSVEGRYRLQWLELFDGYVVDAVEGLLFALLALMALSLLPFDRADRAYPWLAAGLVLLGLHRGNQMFFFLGSYETVHDFEFFIIVLVYPLFIGAWVMAWRAWFRVQTPAWLPKAVAALTLVYVLAQFLGCSWFYGVFPHAVGMGLHYTVTGLRLLLLLSLALVVYQGIRRRGREGWYALPALLAVSVGLFAPELSVLHVPGIWFPFGTGVSRTEYAYAVFDVLLAALLLRRLWSYARRRTIPAPG